MKLQAHLPAVHIGARDWHAATIALAALLGAAILLLALQSRGLLNNLLFERLRPSSMRHSGVDVFHRVSLDVHSLGDEIDPTRRFSVAHQLPENESMRGTHSRSLGIQRNATFWPTRKQWASSSLATVV
jgi:hypothetical protein